MIVDIIGYLSDRITKLVRFYLWIITQKIKVRNNNRLSRQFRLNACIGWHEWLLYCSRSRIIGLHLR